MEYDMSDFLRACVTRCTELTGVSTFRHAATPFSEVPDSGAATVGKFIPEGYGEEFLDGSAGVPSAANGSAGLPSASVQNPGKFGAIASRVLMKVLYAARMARPDLLKAVNSLACLVAKWDEGCDARLHRLVCYINSTAGMKQLAWVGDPPSSWLLQLYADADFAGCAETNKSTSGIFLCVRGPDTFVPLTGISRRQKCVSHSTLEAEIVAANEALRTVGLPALSLWEVVLPVSPLLAI
jgi:hypothetical protein